MTGNGATGSTSGESADPAAHAAADESAAERMRAALKEIRREGWKVAVIYAAVDATLVTLVTNLLLVVGRPAALPERLPIPAAALAAIERVAGVAIAEPTVATSAVVGVLLGLVVFALEVWLRVRRPPIEQFEAANAELREALRTARDAVEDGADTRIALRLYGDVLERLRSASSVGLVDLRRLGATVILVVAVSLATIHLATVDLRLGGVPGTGTTANGDSPAEYGGLQDPDSILGEPENVSAGEANQDAMIDTSGSGSGDPDADSGGGFGEGGFVGGDPGDPQRAGFAEGEQLEDAELIREYNVRIREEGEP